MAKSKQKKKSSHLTPEKVETELMSVIIEHITIALSEKESNLPPYLDKIPLKIINPEKNEKNEEGFFSAKMYEKGNSEFYLNRLKDKFTPNELKLISKNEDDKTFYLYIGISIYGDIIEVSKTHLPYSQNEYHGDWVYEIRVERKVSRHYHNYVAEKTFNQSSFKDLSFKKDTSKIAQKFNKKFHHNLNKFYDKAIFIPIHQNQLTDTDVDKLKEYISTEIIIPFAEEHKLRFIKPDSI